jgi:UDP-3-O-[3-hydroxymyristoyl] N-acetylglucosamine deacetylase
VTLDGPEPPILDGDALVLSHSAGKRRHGRAGRARTAIQVLRPVTVQSGDAKASLLPDDRLSYSYELSFPVIGEQFYRFAFTRAGFKAEIAPARTFGFLSELDALNRMNLAKGASLANTLALDATGVVNREQQRFADEFVRHKILDAIGDMALAGAPADRPLRGQENRVMPPTMRCCGRCSPTPPTTGASPPESGFHLTNRTLS